MREALDVKFCWAKREVERREGRFMGKGPQSPCLKQGGYGAWQRPCDCSGGVTGDKGKVRLEKDTYTGAGLAQALLLSGRTHVPSLVALSPGLCGFPTSL